MTTLNHVGKRTPLADGAVKIKGALRFAPDLHLAGLLEARFVTSPYAHANILSIDKEAALAIPGVEVVITAEDLPKIEPTGRAQLMLARSRVFFVGQPVALVLATDAAAAQDGVDQVFVDYNPLPAAVTVEQALAEGAPLVWPGGKPGQSDETAAHGADTGGDEETESERPSNIAGKNRVERGDVEAGLAEAEVIIERNFTTPMVHQSYLEPHATIVQPDPMTGGATVWSSTQAIFHVRAQVANVLGVPESDVRSIATPVGGGFGGKFLLYEPLVALAAKIVNKPVRLVLTRNEELLAGNPAPPLRIDLKLGAKKDGTLTALKAEVQLNSGCYPTSLTGIVGALMGSVYQTPNMLIEGTDVLTFKPSGAAYRAPGSPQAAFALESTMNDLAETLGIDPIELRLKNASKPGDPLASGEPWPSMGMREVLETLRDHPAWQNRAEAKAAGRGVGIAIGAWFGGIEPSAATCMLDRDGTLNVRISAVDLTGTPTTFALLAAEAFGVDPEKVRVLTGDTDSGPYAGATGGSKTTYTLGPSVIKAAQEARIQTLAIASEELEADPADLEIVDGKVQVRGVPDKGITLAEIAGQTMRFGGIYAPVFAHGRHSVTTRAPGFCAQLAEVEVDEETGDVKVHRLLAIQDVGKAINPLAVEGQIMGGAMQGLGWALHESMIYEEESGQLLTASLIDYTVPHMTDSPLDFETVLVEVPADTGPFGARGVGEPPIVPTAAAVANAIKDQTGVRLTDLPMTSQRVLTGLRNAQSNGRNQSNGHD